MLDFILVSVPFVCQIDETQGYSIVCNLIFHSMLKLHDSFGDGSLTKLVSIFVTYILIAYGSLGLFSKFDLNFVQIGTMMCACFNIVSLMILTFTDSLAEEFKGIFKMAFV